MIGSLAGSLVEQDYTDHPVKIQCFRLIALILDVLLQ
jgi:hypothetical protein